MAITDKTISCVSHLEPSIIATVGDSYERFYPSRGYRRVQGHLEARIDRPSANTAGNDARAQPLSKFPWPRKVFFVNCVASVKTKQAVGECFSSNAPMPHGYWVLAVARRKALPLLASGVPV